MLKFLLVSGPVLGHAGRLRLVADELRRRNAAASFFIPHLSQQTAAALVGYRVQHVYDKPNPPEQRLRFAESLAQHIAANSFDCVVFDINPSIWLEAWRKPSIPAAWVSNAFIVGEHGLPTEQDAVLKLRRQEIDRRRQQAGLPAVTSGRQLFVADRLFLADPEEVALWCKSLPSHAVIAGHCSWQLGGSGDATEEGNDALVFSMGSSGTALPSPDLVARLRAALEPSHCIYVGPAAEAAAQVPGIDQSHAWAALGPLIARARFVVTQGGAGSTYQALAAGVPVGVLPTHLNHAALGRILDDIGLGIALDKLDFDTNLGARYPAMVEGVRAVARHMAQRNGAQMIAESCIELARR